MKERENQGLSLLLMLVLAVSYGRPNLTKVWAYFYNPYYLLLTMGGVAGLLSAYFVLFVKKRVVVLTLLDGAVLLLLGYILLSTGIRYPVMLRGMSVAVLLGTAFLYLLTRQLTDHRFLYLAIGGFGGLVAVHGIVQYLGWLDRPTSYLITGFFSNPGPYAGVLVTIVPLTLALSRAYQKRWVSYAYGAAALAMTVALLLAQSRAALLAGLASGGWVLFPYQKFLHWPRRTRVIAIGGLLIATLALGGGLVAWHPASVQGRLLIFRVGLSMLADAPWLGIGFGRFGIAYSDYQAAYLTAHPEVPYRQLAGMTYYAFNEPLQLANALGFVGFLLVLLVVGLAFVYQTKGTESCLARSLIVAVVIFGLFSYPLSNHTVAVLVAMVLAILSTFGKFASVQIRLLRGAVVAIGVVGLAGSGWYGTVQYQRYQAVQQWKEAAQRVAYHPDEAFRQYQVVYPVLSFYGDFLFNYGAELSEAGRYEQSVRILREAQRLFNHIDLHLYLGNSYQELGEYQQAERAYQHAMHMIPHRFYPRYRLAILYEKTGQRAAAVATARQIMNMPVKVPSTTVANIKADMKRLIDSHAAGGITTDQPD